VGHVRYAQNWLVEGELPRTASHTFTAVDYLWIDHENLAELLLALSYRYLGIYDLPCLRLVKVAALGEEDGDF